MLETTNIPLLLLQSSCFSITLVLSIVLLMSRVHLHTESRAYETSRWMLFAALMLYAVHYMLQMVFGFRARGEDVGALINILFYAPIALLLVCTTLRISLSQRYVRRFSVVGIVGIIVNLCLFGAGLYIYGSLHMLWMLRAMEVVYVAMIAYFIIVPGGALRRMHRKIEDETADDNTKYNLYMRSGTVLLYAMGAVGALSIFRTSTVVMVAAFFLLALVFYVVSFVSLGFSIQGLSSIVEGDTPLYLPEEDTRSLGEEGGDPAFGNKSETSSLKGERLEADASPAAETITHLSAEKVAQIESTIAQWRAEHGYSVSNLTSITMAQRLDIPKRLLTQYLAEHEGSTFRVWLSNIRIEESKRLLLTQPGYSIEAIAEACGFSSRSWMQEKFKASTGMTPAEWREAQKS